MSFVRRMLRQFAVYWPPEAPDKHGEPTWGDPVLLPVRWDQSSTDQSGNQVETEVFGDQVYVSALDGTVGVGGGDVRKGGYLLGPFASSVDLDTIDPSPLVAGAKRITGFSKTADVKARRYLRQATLGQ